MLTTECVNAKYSTFAVEFEVGRNERVDELLVALFTIGPGRLAAMWRNVFASFAKMFRYSKAEVK